MVKIIAQFLVSALCLILYSCAATTSGFKLISEKQSVSKLNGSDFKILREYYVAKSYKSKSPTYSELDSLALALGHTKGKNYNLYYASYFSSRQFSKADSVFFNSNDSISIIRRNVNLVNYIFKNGLFREKQIIKNGKILKPKYDVDIKFNDAPDIKFYN